MLYRQGVSFQSEAMIRREHIIMYGEAAETVDLSGGKLARQRARYLRGLNLWMDHIKAEFHVIRQAMHGIHNHGLHAFIRQNGIDFRVKLLPPFINICYTYIAFPPRIKNSADEKKCFGGHSVLYRQHTRRHVNQQGNLPFPWGDMLEAEEHIDQPGMFTTMLLTIAMAMFGCWLRELQLDSASAKIKNQ